MAAVAEQPPPPCFFSLFSSPLSCSTAAAAAPTTVSPLLIPSTPPLPPSPVTVPTVLLFSPLCVMMDMLEPPSSVSNLPPFSPTSLSHASFSLHFLLFLLLSTHTHTHTHTQRQVCALRYSLPWATRCYPRAIRAYYICIRLPMSSPHPLPASHLDVCVGRNQGQERNRPAMAPRAIDSTRRSSWFHHDHDHDYVVDDDDDDDDDTKGVARGNLYLHSTRRVVFNYNSGLWITPEVCYRDAHSFTGNLVSFGSLAHGRDCLVIYLPKGRMRVAPILYLLLYTTSSPQRARPPRCTSLKHRSNGVCKSAGTLLFQYIHVQ